MFNLPPSKNNLCLVTYIFSIDIKYVNVRDEKGKVSNGTDLDETRTGGCERSVGNRRHQECSMDLLVLSCLLWSGDT